MQSPMIFALVLALSVSASALAQTPWLDEFLRRESFGKVKISPDGEFLAATIPMEDRTTLAILRLRTTRLPPASRWAGTRMCTTSHGSARPAC